MRIGCCAYSYRQYLTSGDMVIEDFIDLASDIGIDGVELTAYYFPTTEKDYLHSLKRRCLVQGVDVSGAAVGSKLTLAFEDERAAEVRMVKEWLGHAVELGAPELRFFCRGDARGPFGRGGLQLGRRRAEGVRSGGGGQRCCHGPGESRWHHHYVRSGYTLDTGN